MAVFAPKKPGQPVTNLPSKKRVGFLGVGNITLDHIATVIKLGHQVAAGCATSQDTSQWNKFKNLAPQSIFVPDPTSLLQSPNIDAVVSCLPWNITQTYLPKLLETQKPVLIEKPVALTTTILQDALNNPNSNPENKLVGLNRRFYTTVDTLKRRVSQGGVKSVEIVISETVERLSNIYGPEIIPYIPVYNSCHILDTAVHIFGKLNPIHIYGHEDTSYATSYRSLTGLLETRSRKPVFLVATAENPVPSGIRVLFDDRTTWHLSPMERLIAYRGYRTIEPSERSNIRQYVPESFLEITEDSTLKPGFLGQMRSFLEGHKRHISATLTQSLDLLRLIDSLYNVPFSKPIDTT